MQISAHLEVSDALLEFHEDVVHLGVELITLVKHVRQLLVCRDCLVNLREEGGLGRVRMETANHLLELRASLSDSRSDLLLLFLELLVLGEVLLILLGVLLEDRALIHLALEHSHKILHSIEVIVHLNSFLHDLAFLVLDHIEVGHSFLENLDSSVFLLRRRVFGNHSTNLCSSLGQEFEPLFVGCILLLDLRVGLPGHTELLLVISQLLLVLTINRR